MRSRRQPLERKTDMVDHHGRFVWHELLTTDTAAAKGFYADVLGWGAQDASTPDLAYTLFTSGTAAVGGLMSLPDEATKMGATPRWVGYVGVNDANAAADRIKRLGGAVYVPPTNTNIGRIAIAADPQSAPLAVVEGLKLATGEPAESGKAGDVDWSELLAADCEKAFAFYGALFGWQRANAGIEPGATYQLFSCGGRMIGGMLTKPAAMPDPFWLHYFTVGDVEVTVARVEAGGGQIFFGPQDSPDGSCIARCTDPQGAVFALEGARSPGAVRRPASWQVGWSTEWGGFSSKGRLVTKPGS
jgi:predicted enzyme related to lactoylglutathione lyase